MTRPFVTELHYVGFIDEICKKSIWFRLYEQSLSKTQERDSEFLAQILKKRLPRAERKRILLGINADVRFGYYDRRKGRVRGCQIRLGPILHYTAQERKEIDARAEELYKHFQELLSPIDDL